MAWLSNCRFIAGDVLKAVGELDAKPDLIVLDPPRDGIHPKALEKIIGFGVERMVYIACKPTSLVRDLEVFLENGYTKEEEKMINETRKILNKPELKITATTVRVPVVNSHSESINVEFEQSFDLNELKEALKNAPGVIVQDDPENNIYPLALNATGHDESFVGRIRRDFSVESGINFWCVSDNIRKGAASNAVQIVQKLIEFDNENN